MRPVGEKGVVEEGRAAIYVSRADEPITPP